MAYVFLVTFFDSEGHFCEVYSTKESADAAAAAAENGGFVTTTVHKKVAP